MITEKVFLQGYGFSGISAARDFLQEFSSIHVFKPEFDLCRANGGIFEMGELIENGSMYTHDSMIRRFKKLIDFTYYKLNWKNEIGESFWEMSNKFVDEFVLKQVQTKDRSFSMSERLILPIAKFPYRSFTKRYKKKIKHLNNDKNVFYLKSCSKGEYIKKAKDYLEAVFNLFPNNKQLSFCHTLSILNQKIDDQLNYFDNFKVVLIDRDPRDIYVTLFNNTEEYTAVFKEVEDFIQIFKQRRTHHLHNMTLLKDNVLALKFEDFVLQHETVADQLIDFLKLDRANQAKGMFFNPLESRKTVAIYKSHKYQNDIKLIEKMLPEYIDA